MEMSRNQKIIRTSWVVIAGNIFLAVFKLAVGTITNSVAIILDAVNNLTDGMSSLVTIVGTRLSEKEPDRKHPFGYGRLEYITSLTVGIIILYAGIAAVRESIHRIIEPEPSEYTATALMIVAVAVLVKILMGVYTLQRGKVLESVSLIASGHDALDGSIETAAAFIAAIIYVRKGISLEAYVGLAISVLIFKTGLETLRETVSNILGEKVDSQLAAKVKDVIRFDVTADFDMDDSKAMRKALGDKIREVYPGYDISITIGYEFSS